MKQIRNGKRLLAVALSVLLAFGGLPTAALAEGQPVQVTQGLCEHHQEHTAECGYAEGQPCEHEHSEDCYNNELTCGYDKETETTASDSEAEHTHTQECYALDCPHESGKHDDTCGYAEAQPCGYPCELCGKTDNEPEPKPGDETEQTACTLTEGCPLVDGHEGGCMTKPENSVTETACTLTEGCTLSAGHEGKCVTEPLPEGAGTITVTAFDKLEDAVKQVPLNTTWDGLNLPATLGASGYTVADDIQSVPEPEAISIEGVTWEVFEKDNSPAAYEESRPTPCIYWLRAVLPEGYALDKGAILPEIQVRYGMALRANGGLLSKGQTLISIGAKTGDVITIQSDFTGEVKIPASITALTLKSNGALTDTYITSEAAVSLTIDGLDITAPAGTNPPIGDVTGSYPAINLAGDSTLTVKGSNAASGGIESAGIRVSAGQSLTVRGGGDLRVSAGDVKNNASTGAAAIGGNGCYISDQQLGEVCGVISIKDTVTLRLQGSGFGSELGGGGGGINLAGSITISGKPILTAPGGLYLHAATLTIDGGTIDANMFISTSIINSENAALNRVDIPTGNAGHIQVEKEGDADYSYTASTQPDGAAYIWLPSSGSYEIRVDRGTHIEVYLVKDLGFYAEDLSGYIDSNLVFTQPDASYSHHLEVSSATLSPITYNKGTVEVVFNQKPADDTDGSVSVSKDGFVTESALTRISAEGNVYTYSYADLPDGTYTVRVRGFKDSSGYENPIHQSTPFAVATAAVTIKGVSGVTAPTRGAMPVTAITETDQYTGTVSWNPNHSTFAADTDYTATITLTPKAGYTLQGVAENFFTVAGSASVTNAADSGVITAVFPKTDKQVYTVTVESSGNGTASASAINAVEGETVTLSSTADNGYHFKEWQVISGGITITNNQFTMPAGDVTVKAVFEKNSSGSNVIIEPSKPAGNQSSLPNTGVIEPEAEVEKDGTVKVVVSDKDIQDAIDRALAQARKDGTQSGGIAVAIDMTGLKTQFNTLPLTLSKTAYNKLVKAGVKSLDIRTPQISLSLDLATLKTIHASATGDVTINADKADPAMLPGELSTRPAYNLTITSGGNTISQFGGYVALTLPYALQAGEQGGNLQMAYVGADGKLNPITDSSYNAGAKTLIGRTNHFTVFGIVNRPAPAFSDIENHWAKDDILFVASRELLSGAGSNQFSPNTGMTRGMFVTALGRLAGVNPDSYKTRSFTDVKADAYYAAYVEWAAQKNIVSGTGDKLFSPDAPVTREQIAVMMTNYAGQMGYSIPTPLAAVTFADGDKISTWAAKEVAAMQRAGIIKGKDGNRFDPQGNATRAEVSAVLHRFVEIVIDPVTAQGWVKNDSGQWLYYKDGKAITGWKQFGGKWYYFDENGIMAVDTKIDGYEIGPDGARKERN